MNEKINDGGNAFPHAQRLWDNDAQSWAVHSVGGMSLRDWFAGKALQGLLASGHFTAKDACDGPWFYVDQNHDEEGKRIKATARATECAFRLADNALAARKGQP